jgi:hypothetical protein
LESELDIEEIYVMWKADGIIGDNVSSEGRRIPELHSKYYKLYVTEALRLKKARSDLKVLTQLKSTYFKGEMDLIELKKYGWEPQNLKLLRSDVPQYVEADPEIIKKTLAVGFLEEMVAYLESIVKQINNRNFVLKTIVDWDRFINGG